MIVHRLLVDSSKRLSGHTFDFGVDVSQLSTNQDFLRSSHMVAVEWVTPVSYSEFQDAFGPDERHPPSLLLTWDRPAPNVFGQPNALVHLQQFESRGFYGVTADTPYISRKTMGTFLQGDTLNRAGVLRFRVLQEAANGLFTPCLQQIPGLNYGKEFQVMLVFWSHPAPEQPLSFDFYKIFLNTLERTSGTTDNCLVPVQINTNSSMNLAEDKWMLAVDSISLLKSSSITSSLILKSDTFRTSSDYDGDIIAYLHRTKADAKVMYGQRLSIKQTPGDTIGIPVTTKLDSLQSVNLRIEAADGEAPELLEDYTVCFVVYKA